MRMVGKLVMLAVMLASGSGPRRRTGVDIDMAKRLADVIVATRDVRGVKILYCSLCGKGPFTPKGLYLHIVRVHSTEVERIVDELADDNRR
jgi:hypothetical protein